MGGVKSGNTSPPQEVTRFLKLLVQPKPPTLAESNNIHTYSDEMEFSYEQLECNARGWGGRSPECIRFSSHRRDNAHKIPSFRFADIRRRLSEVVGKQYEVISVRVKDATGKYLTAKEVMHITERHIAIGVVQVKIGKNVYELHYKPAVLPADVIPIAIRVTAVNGKIFYEQPELTPPLIREELEKHKKRQNTRGKKDNHKSK